MASIEKAVATQIANIEKKTGKSLAQLGADIAKCGKSKHGEIRGWLMETYGLGHGDADALIHAALKLGETSAAKETGVLPIPCSTKSTQVRRCTFALSTKR